jgi:hypothetical protein
MLDTKKPLQISQKGLKVCRFSFVLADDVNVIKNSNMERFIPSFFWGVISLMTFSASTETVGAMSTLFVVGGVVSLLFAVVGIVRVYLD